MHGELHQLYSLDYEDTQVQHDHTASAQSVGE